MNESQANPTANILVVDDIRTNLHLLVKILGERGYTVRPTTSGRMALAAAQADPPHLILLDIVMPEMDGYTVCRQLKADERTRDIPVLFISGLSETEDIVRAFSAGGVDYITKPFREAEVLARVETHLTLHHLRRKLQETNQELARQIQVVNRANAELHQRNAELQEAIGTIKSLSGLVPVCAWCRKKIRDEHDEWVALETYLEEHSGATITHGICPDCRRKHHM